MSYAIRIPTHYLHCGYILQYIWFYIFCRWISKEFVKQNPFLTLPKMVAAPNLDFSLHSEESQKIHKYKVKFPLVFANDTRNQIRQSTVPQLYIVFYAYIDIYVSDKNRDVLSSEIIYWVSLVLSSHFLFQLLRTNGWSCSVSSPQALREKHTTYCFYLSLNLFSATSQGDMIINLQDNVCA